MKLYEVLHVRTGIDVSSHMKPKIEGAQSQQ